MGKKEHHDLHRYSFWVMVNKALMGPSLIISAFIIICYCFVTILTFVKPEWVMPYIIHYYIAFPVFIVAVWLGFTGVLLKDT